MSDFSQIDGNTIRDSRQSEAVANVAALAAVRMLDGGSIATLGHTTAGDGGGQDLIYHATGRTGIAANVGTYVNGSDDYFEAADKHTVTPEQFGMVGDGATDDSAILANALAGRFNWSVRKVLSATDKPDLGFGPYLVQHVALSD